MSDVLVAYKQQNKYDKYHLLTTAEQSDINSVTTNFIQELVTDLGSCIFDRNYGSTFIKEVGAQTNIHKINFILRNSISLLKDKYQIVNVATGETSFNTNDGFLDIKLKIEFSEIAVEKYFNFMYAGVYTEKTILEMD